MMNLWLVWCLCIIFLLVKEYVVRIVVGKRIMIDEIDVLLYVVKRNINVDMYGLKIIMKVVWIEKKNYDKICVELKKFNFRIIIGKLFGILNIISGICDLRFLLKK